ncbi:MAG: beta-propeller domain-containing protein [Microthrixaceae bacterium]
MTAVAGVAIAASTLSGCSKQYRDSIGLVAELRPYRGCDQLLDDLRSFGQERVRSTTDFDTGVGESLVQTDRVAGRAASAAPQPMDAGTVAGPAVEDAPGEASSTGTNNQEADVDEADMVKVVGDRVVTVSRGRLVVLSMAGGSPALIGSVDLPGTTSAGTLLVQGDRAIVIGQGDDARSRLTEVSLHGDPAVSKSLEVDGTVLDGREHDGTIRLVMSSELGGRIPVVQPGSDTSASLDQARRANLDAIRRSTIEDWMPQVHDGGKSRPLLPCDRMMRPAEASGLGLLSILSMADGLDSLTGTAIVADTGITYASTTGLYVATSGWPTADRDDTETPRTPPTDGPVTDIHRFAITGDAPAAYEASGRIEGSILNQYSMSESHGRLRVATTRRSSATAACPSERGCIEPMRAGGTDSQVVILERDGTSLKEIGRVDGLGKGEQIKAVRYVGDTAYVVTFRQTDPLYVLDLSAPTAPRLVGELKLPGFSQYLHPVGDDLLLGVGVDGDDDGQTDGAKVSLFDVSDPLHPVEASKWTSRAQFEFMTGYDPHAFHWDASRSTVLLPYLGACFENDCEEEASGVLVVRIEGRSLTEIGRIRHHGTGSTVEPPSGPATTTTVAGESTAGIGESTAGIGADGVAAPDPGVAAPVVPLDPLARIERVFVMGDRIVTVSDEMLAAHTVDDLQLVGSVRW